MITSSCSTSDVLSVILNVILYFLSCVPACTFTFAVLPEMVATVLASTVLDALAPPLKSIAETVPLDKLAPLGNLFVKSNPIK